MALNSTHKPVLPLDVCLEVIDAVSIVDGNHMYATLRACALTCSAWLRRARHHLYSEVFLQHHPPTAFVPFFRTISCSLELGMLVKCLQADLSNREEHGEADTLPVLVGKAIGNLPNLRELYLRYVCGISATIHSLLREFLRANSARTLGLVGWTFDSFRELVGYLEGMSHVRYLTISECFWVDLAVYEHSEIKPGFCKNLIELSLDGNLAYDPFLQIMPASIRFLRMGPHLPEERRDTYDPVDTYDCITRFTALEWLHLAGNYQEKYDWILTVLTNIRSPHVRALSLEYGLSGTPESEDILCGHLVDLDRLLSNMPLLRTIENITVLKRLWFDLKSVPDAEEQAARMRRELASLLRECQQRRVTLIFEIEFDPFG
ncbi:hypothetical protein OH77DRAFT_1432043 [Trametes cingulata]|nr:hypothetical protein OH77DRAFT_1432043 [Trametes cingulata]